MGYTARSIRGDVTILSRNFDKALRSVKDLSASRENHFDYTNSDQHSTWVTLDEALADWRWEVNYDLEGNIVKMHFTGENVGDDQLLFNVLKPYFQPGSRVTMMDYEGDRWDLVNV